MRRLVRCLVPALFSITLMIPSRSAASADGVWKQIGPPDGRAGYTVIYDSARDRVVLFGGVKSNGLLADDVWLLLLSGSGTPRWMALNVTGTPPAKRMRHTAVYDPARQRMLVFGGWDGSNTYFNDVWSLALPGNVGGIPVAASWTQLSPAGTPPGSRMGHAAIYDPVRDRMVVHAGVGASDRYGDLWSLSLSGSPAWSEITPVAANPPAREGHVAVYDSGRDQMVIFGGTTGSSGGTLANDAWALSLAGTPAWTALPASGAPPAPRSGSMAVYDVDSDRMLLFGGSFPGAENDTWSLGLSGSPPAWTQLSPGGTVPSARRQGGIAYRASADQVLLLGGVSPDSVVLALDLYRFEDETPSWSIVPVEPGVFAGDIATQAIYDSARKRILMLGGTSHIGGTTVVTALSLGWLPHWSPLSATNPFYVFPEYRTVYDPVRDRILLNSGSGILALSLTGEPTWQVLATAGPEPPYNVEGCMVYDPVGDRVIVALGGDGDLYNVYNDVWALTLSGTPTWSQIIPNGTPPSPRINASVIYDPLMRHLIFFGGGQNAAAADNEVWSLSLDGTPSWTQLSPLGTPPTPRQSHVAVYDSARRRMVVHGGWWPGTMNDGFDDTWALSLSEPPTWTQLAPSGATPGRRFLHVAVYDPELDRMFIFGGLQYWGVPQRDLKLTSLAVDARALEWSAVTAVAPATVPESPARIVRTYPNPFGGHASIELGLPRSSPARLAVFDVSGRLVRLLYDGSLPAGTNHVEWDTLDRDGRQVGAGVYFFKLEVGGRVSTHRAIILR